MQLMQLQNVCVCVDMKVWYFGIEVCNGNVWYCLSMLSFREK